MLILSISTHNFDGDVALIGCDEIRPVGDYSLVGVRISADGKPSRAESQLERYSRWSEPGFGLTARLISGLPQFPNCSLPATPFKSSLRFGRSGRPIETLSVELDGSQMLVTLRDDFGMTHVTGAARQGYGYPLGLIEHAARLACWSQDAEPAIPPPLTNVPVRTRDGQLVVCTADIPAHPWRHLRGQLTAGKAPAPEYISAWVWWAFIGAALADMKGATK